MPKFQFNRQDHLKITDENRESRNVVRYIKSENHQRNGTVLAIDFEDAFKSTNSKCCNLFFKAMNMNITVAPLCSALDEVLEGIYTPD